MARRLEAALGRYRALSIAALGLLTGLAWVWLWQGAGLGMASFASLLPPPVEHGMGPSGTMADMNMPGMDMTGMDMTGFGAWTGGRLMLTFLMWWTMMIAMMLPSAAPTILLHARSAAHGNPAVRPATASFLFGYLAAWAGFSWLATLLQMILGQAGLVGPLRMASQSHRLSGAILLAVGLYQLSPVKEVCLNHCRNPAGFLIRHYRPGSLGAMRMGLVHGTYCIGCCWLLMALLFVGGVMNLVWIALLTLIVAGEKLLPIGRILPLISGVFCVVWGMAILLS